MSVFSRKKDEAVNYDKYLVEFSNFKDSIDRENEYKSMVKLYEETYNFYIRKIKEDNLNINAEKLLLERRIGKYNSEKSKANINIIVGVFCALVPIYIQGFIDLNQKYKALITMGAVIVTYISFMRDFGKDIINDKNKDVMYNVCLKTLNDIEKEFESQQLNFKKTADTKEDTGRRNLFANIIGPAAMEVAVTLTEKNSWIRKLLRHKKYR